MDTQFKSDNLHENENLSTEVTEEDLAGGQKDECGIIYSKDGKRLLRCGNEELEGYSVRKGTKVICDGAFGGCSSLESIIIPGGVESIGECAFSCCESLKSISLPDSLTSIGDEAFYGCESLERIIIPGGVTSIGEHAFSECSSLENIEISKDVTSIEPDALVGHPLKYYSLPPASLLEDACGQRDSETTKSDNDNTASLQQALKENNLEYPCIVSDPANTHSTIEVIKTCDSGVLAKDMQAVLNTMREKYGIKDIRAYVKRTDKTVFEIPLESKCRLSFLEALESDRWELKSRPYDVDEPKSERGYKLPAILGGEDAFELATNSIVCGMSGAGKSMFLRSAMCSLLYSRMPHEVKFAVVDPRNSFFECCSQLLLATHYLAVCEDAVDGQTMEELSDARMTLKSLLKEMELRQSNLNVNELPYILVFADDIEMLDEDCIKAVEKLAISGPEVKISVIATTGSHLTIERMDISGFRHRVLMRAIVPPSRFVGNASDCRLLQPGEYLFGCSLGEDTFIPSRLLGAYISDEEFSRILHYVHSQQGEGLSYREPYYLPSVL